MPYKTRKRKAAATKSTASCLQKKPLLPKESSPSSGAMSSSPLLDASSARSNDTHIFFWGSVLSNFHIGGTAFTGARCFELLLPDLQSLATAEGGNSDMAITYPPANAFSTRLISDHNFICGEQWMMAMKAWFFEGRDLPDDKRLIEHGDREAEAQYQTLKAQMYLPQMPREWMKDVTGCERERALWQSNLGQVLRSKKPREQKNFGRRVRGFDVTIWDKVSVPCVVAACVARAEIDPNGLRKVYLGAEGRSFVEGSQLDTVWGVGIHWKEAAIEDPEKWCGENRLGRCHDEATSKIRQMFTESRKCEDDIAEEEIQVTKDDKAQVSEQ